MNFRDVFQTRMAKKGATEVSQLLIKHPERIEEVFNLIEENEYPQSVKAAYTLRTLAELSKETVAPYAERIFKLLPVGKHSGQRRDLQKALLVLWKKDLIQDEDLKGEFLDYAFNRLGKPESATAERYYSLELLCLNVPEYPELLKEIEDTFEMIRPIETASFQQYGRKMIESARSEIQA